MAQLVSTNVGGNVHQATDWANKTGLAQYVIQMGHTGHNTLVVLRTPDDVAPKLRKLLGHAVCTNPQVHPAFAALGRGTTQ